MLKRIVLTAVGAVAAGIMVFGFLYMQKNTLKETDPFAAVAEDAVIIVRSQTIQGFLSALNSRKGLWTDLNRVSGTGFLVRQVEYLDSLFGLDQEISGLASDKGLCFSIHPTGKDRYGAVFYTGLSRAAEIRTAGELMHRLMSQQGSVRERSMGRVKIYEAALYIDGKKRELSWALSNGLLMLSFSPILLENAVTQSAAGGNVTDDAAFQRVHSTSGINVDANIYINLAFLPRYLSAFTKGDVQRFLKDFSDLANWAELDLHLRDDELMMNGFSYSDTGGDNYLNVFRNQSPVQIGVESVIPGFSSAFLAMGFSDKEAFNDNYYEWLDNTGRLKDYTRMADSFTRLTGADPVETFHSFMEQEVAMVLTGWEDPGEAGESFLVIKTQSRSMASESLQAMLEHHAGMMGNNAGSYKQVYQVDRETSFDIYRFPFSNTGELLFGMLFRPVKTSYYCFVGNYLVFGESVSGLSSFIHANVLNQTLSENRRFIEFSDNLVERNNFFFYSSVPRSAGLFTGIFREEHRENLAGGLESFRKFQAVSLQFSYGRDMLYNNIFLKYSPVAIEEPRTEWQTLLDTIIDFKPLLTLNHNTGENEIFVQDLNNTIYLINNTGRILWKKHLDSRIMGDVHQIDYYNNGRLQFLFNTREQIFLIDRNSNAVGRYPIRLPSPATNGIAVFDYDNDRNYRIFVACEDKSVVVRSKDGNIVSGWEFPGTEHNVYHKIKFFRTGGRDYIVFADRQRVYITDRRGSIRVRPDALFPVSLHNPIAFEPGRSSDPRLALTDTLGRVWHIYLNGKTRAVSLGDYSSGHFFEYHDITGDGSGEYIFLDKNRLDVYSRDGSALFSHEFDVPVRHAPLYYHFSRSDRKLGVVSQDGGQIFLFNSNGEIYNGFPLTGRASFTIGSLQPGQGNFHLIVGSDSNFLYNYTVY
jgi:hypothetical protein